MCTFDGARIVDVPVFHPDRLADTKWNEGFFYFQLVPGVILTSGANMGSNPASASLDQGNRYIHVNGPVCAQMHFLVVYFVLMHELAHHVLGHTSSPCAQQNVASRERMADRLALIAVLLHYPHWASRVFQQTYNFFNNRGSNGNGTHPSDAERAGSVVTAWNELCRNKCFVRVENDNSISEEQAVRCLNALGHRGNSQTPNIRTMLDEANRDGHIMVPSPTSRGSARQPYTFDEVDKYLSQLEVGVKFGMAKVKTSINWTTLTPCPPKGGGNGRGPGGGAGALPSGNQKAIK